MRLNRREVDKDLIDAVQQTERESLALALERSNIWKSRVLKRMEDDFFPWHFSYFGDISRDAEWVWKRLISGKERADENYELAIATKFSETVGSPEQLEKEMNEIVTVSIDHYNINMRERVGRVEQAYRLRNADIRQYIDSIQIKLTSESGIKKHLGFKDLFSHGSLQATAYVAVGLLTKNYVSRANVASLGLEMCNKPGSVANCQKLVTAAYSKARGMLGRIGMSARTVVVYAHPITLALGVGYLAYDEHKTHSERKEAQSRLIKDNISKSLDGMAGQLTGVDGVLTKALSTISHQIIASVHSR